MNATLSFFASIIFPLFFASTFVFSSFCLAMRKVYDNREKTADSRFAIVEEVETTNKNSRVKRYCSAPRAFSSRS